jgi:hypothetical protein
VRSCLVNAGGLRCPWLGRRRAGSRLIVVAAGLLSWVGVSEGHQHGLVVPLDVPTRRCRHPEARSRAPHHCHAGPPALRR